MEAEIFKELHKRIVRSFMDIVILVELRKGRPLSGYDVVAFIHKKFGLLMSSGTVYSTLYALERKGLVEGMCSKRTRVYKLTDLGKETINIILKAYEKIENFMATLCK